METISEELPKDFLNTSENSNIGIAGGSSNYNQVYIDGKPHHRMKQTNLVNHVVELVEEYAKNGIKAK